MPSPLPLWVLLPPKKTIARLSFAGSISSLRFFPWLIRYVPYWVGGLLLVAAALKAHALWAEPAFGSPLGLAILVEVELVVGLALVLRVWPCATRWVALAVFAGFMGTAFSFALAGARSCACFGKVEVHPWLAVLLGNIM